MTVKTAKSYKITTMGLRTYVLTPLGDWPSWAAELYDDRWRLIRWQPFVPVRIME